MNLLLGFTIVYDSVVPLQPHEKRLFCSRKTNSLKDDIMVGLFPSCRHVRKNVFVKCIMIVKLWDVFLLFTLMYTHSFSFVPFVSSSLNVYCIVLIRYLLFLSSLVYKILVSQCLWLNSSETARPIFMKFFDHFR